MSDLYYDFAEATVITLSAISMAFLGMMIMFASQAGGISPMWNEIGFVVGLLSVPVMAGASVRLYRKGSRT